MNNVPEFEGEDSLAQSMMDAEADDPDGLLLCDEEGNLIRRPNYDAEKVVAPNQ